MPSRAFKLVGFSLYEEAPTFALPIFRSEREAGIFIQVADELSDTIVDFQKVENPSAVTQLPRHALHLKIGQRQVFIFINEKSQPIVGPLNDIEGGLRAFVIRCPQHRAVCLQVMELVGSADERKAARLRMRAALELAQGTSAANRFYERSVLRLAFWRRLAASAKTPELAGKIAASRARLDITLKDNGEFELHLDDLIDELDQVDLIQLKAALAAEFETNPPAAAADSNFAPPATEQNGSQGLYPDAYWEQVVAFIRAKPRQEERLACLFEFALEQPLAALELFDRYGNDMAAFTSNILHQLREYLRQQPILDQAQASLPGIVKQDERSRSMAVLAAVMLFIDVSFSYIYGMRKGILFLDLATHLGRFRDANELLRLRLRMTRSEYVRNQQADIRRALQRPAPARWPLFTLGKRT